ncbi:MAG: GNAT family N-acetyltransferase [Clostridiales bacterium]|nr:GNAT family N-acetyltransferase [Clostridiales bacterium]
MNPIGTKDIYTQRLHLRRLLPDDAQAAFDNWTSDEKVTKFLRWEPHINVNMTRALFESWQEQYDNPFHFEWVIVLDGQPIGSIQTHSMTQHSARCEISYHIGSRFWGKGYMTEALLGVMEYLFTRVGLNKLEGRYDILNTASGRVMEKAGMVKEGVLRAHSIRKDGTYADVVAMGITKEDWLKMKGERV